MKILGIIPARYSSTRFPGKSLTNIAGKTMIQRVYEQVKKAKRLAHVIVATDHQKIYRHMHALGAPVCMTSQAHKSGTDRCCEALKLTQGSFDYVINVQGDEPLIAPDQIDSLASLLDGQVQIATLIKKIDDAVSIHKEGTVKVVINKKEEAIYFSRSPIPYVHGKPKEMWLSLHPYFKHIGLYAYRVDILEKLSGLPVSSLEEAESLEQLRWIENGYVIKVGKTAFDSSEVDTREDLDSVLTRLNKKG